MRFRPCIDIHDGKVKQIVGSTLKDGEQPVTNFSTDRPPEDFARMYKRDNLPGGHVIMLGPGNEDAAIAALRAYPGGMHVGGGITADNAAKYLDEGASHVIVTSFVFRQGKIHYDNLDRLVRAVGKQRLVLDLSCKRRGEDYIVVTDRWQNDTDVAVNRETLEKLATYCDEFLVHAADVEGKRGGILPEVVRLLADSSPVPVTYAGGASTIGDLDLVKDVGGGRVDLTIGSALDIFGGNLSYEAVVRWQREQEKDAAAR